MNTRLFILLGCFAFRVGFGQGTFQNLGFESAQIIPIPGDPVGRVLFAPAFPGWTGYINGTAQTSSLHNDEFQTIAAFSILDQSSRIGVPFEGQYAAELEANTISGDTQVYLSQTGLVPSGSLSLRLYAYNPIPGAMSVSLNGTALNLFQLQQAGTTFPPYSLYAADISAFAGQAAELRIMNFKHAGVITAPVYLDGISFSPNAVPELGMWALLTLGGALFWGITRRRRE